MPAPKIALADLIALAHSDTHPDANDTVELVAERLQNQIFESIYILPCTRDLAPPWSRRTLLLFRLDGLRSLSVNCLAESEKDWMST